MTFSAALDWVGGDLVAIAAIFVGGLVALGGAWLGIQASRRARQEERRYEAYALILPVIWQMDLQASDHATFPGNTTVPDADDEMVRQIQAKLMLVGSKAVRDAFTRWRMLLAAYWPQVFQAAVARKRADAMIDPETDRNLPGWDKAYGEAEIARIGLSGPYSELVEASDRLEAVMRADIQPK